MTDYRLEQLSVELRTAWLERQRAINEAEIDYRERVRKARRKSRRPARAPWLHKLSARVRSILKRA